MPVSMPEDRRWFRLRPERSGKEILRYEQRVRVSEMFDKYLRKTGQKKW